MHLKQTYLPERYTETTLTDEDCNRIVPSPIVCAKRPLIPLSSLETAIANDVQHLQLQGDGAGSALEAAAEETGQEEDGMNKSGWRRRESIATSGYLSADEDGKMNAMWK